MIIKYCYSGVCDGAMGGSGRVAVAGWSLWALWNARETAVILVLISMCGCGCAAVVAVLVAAGGSG
jgi:hypothetical protein